MVLHDHVIYREPLRAENIFFYLKLKLKMNILKCSLKMTFSSQAESVSLSDTLSVSLKRTLKVFVKVFLCQNKFSLKTIYIFPMHYQFTYILTML